MGWEGISLLEPREGVPPEQVFESTLAEYLVFGEEGPHLEPVPQHDTSSWPPPDPDWSDGAIAALRSVNPRLRRDPDNHAWDDGVGPVLFRDYAGEVHIKLARHHECPVGEDDHAMLWRYITAVNESVGCLAFDLDTSTQLDPTLDVEEARVRYWLI